MKDLKIIETYEKRYVNTKTWAINCITKGDTAKEFLSKVGYENMLEDFYVFVKWRNSLG